MSQNSDKGGQILTMGLEIMFRGTNYMAMCLSSLWNISFIF